MTARASGANGDGFHVGVLTLAAAVTLRAALTVRAGAPTGCGCGCGAGTAEVPDTAETCAGAAVAASGAAAVATDQRLFLVTGAVATATAGVCAVWRPAAAAAGTGEVGADGAVSSEPRLSS